MKTTVLTILLILMAPCSFSQPFDRPVSPQEWQKIVENYKITPILQQSGFPFDKASMICSIKSMYLIAQSMNELDEEAGHDSDALDRLIEKEIETYAKVDFVIYEASGAKLPHLLRQSFDADTRLDENKTARLLACFFLSAERNVKPKTAIPLLWYALTYIGFIEQAYEIPPFFNHYGVTTWKDLPEDQRLRFWPAAYALMTNEAYLPLLFDAIRDRNQPESIRLQAARILIKIDKQFILEESLAPLSIEPEIKDKIICCKKNMEEFPGIRVWYDTGLNPCDTEWVERFERFVKRKQKMEEDMVKKAAETQKAKEEQKANNQP